MKKVLIVILIIALIVIVFFAVKYFRKTDNTNTTNTTNITNDIDTGIDTASKIEIGSETYIDQLEQIPIGDSDDFVIITEKRKWEVPEHEEGTTVSFTIQIPYTIHVDGVDYDGIYYLNDYKNDAENLDKNPKYSFEITDLTPTYETKVLIIEK